MTQRLPEATKLTLTSSPTESARLTEAELLARMRRVQHPNPLVHVGPAYPIQTFEHWGKPYPDYYYGAVTRVDSWLGEKVWVEERP